MSFTNYIGPDDHWGRLDAWMRADRVEHSRRVRGYDFALPVPPPLPEKPAPVATPFDWVAFANENHQRHEERQARLRKLNEFSDLRQHLE